MPWFWIVAGPNGAGKSTLVDVGLTKALTGTPLVVLNADILTRQLLADDPGLADANLKAAIATDAAVAEAIQNNKDVLVETVLSSDKYVDDVATAKDRGFGIGMIYVGLVSSDLSLARVALRVARGGHAVPSDRIHARWTRSIAMLGRYAPIVDRLFVFDNSRADGPRLIAMKADGRLSMLEPGRIPEIDAVLTDSLTPRPTDAGSAEPTPPDRN